MEQGTFIVLEGVDGSGKGTQFRLLSERLKAVGYEVAVFDFPRYDQPSSYFVKRYLNGDYGPASSISPYNAALFYALDRFEAAAQIRQALKEGKVVLSNRYVGSNMAHQGSKFTNEAEQRGFFIWADSLEYQLLDIPRPTLNIFLRVPAEIAFDLIAKKTERSYTDKKHDEHEADIDHLRASLETYDNLCRLFPKDFIAIDCTEEGKLLSIPTVNEKIWQIVKPLLPAKPTGKARSAVVKLESGRGPNQPTTMPKSPTGASKKSISLLALIELLRNKDAKVIVTLPWQHPKVKHGYYTPADLPPKTLKKYRSTMERLVAEQEELRAKLIKFDKAAVEQALRMVFPLASLSQAEIINLPQDNDLPELSGKAKIDKAQSSKQKPLTTLVRDRLPANLSTELEPITLLNAWPRNEFETLADSLYGLSDLPRAQLQSEIETWTYEQKREALLNVFAEQNTAAPLTNYSFDVIIDQAQGLELVLALDLQNLQIQPATPRYGYELPRLIEEAGAEEEFINCFDTSLELFSDLQMIDNGQWAAYATLLGHKIRLQFSVDFKNLAKMTAIPALKGLSNLLLERIGENHPITAQYLSNLNQAPKPQSSRRRRRSK